MKEPRIYRGPIRPGKEPRFYRSRWELYGEVIAEYWFPVVIFFLMMLSTVGAYYASLTPRCSP